MICKKNKKLLYWFDLRSQLIGKLRGFLNKISIAFLFLFLSACGLRLGEKAPSVFKYKLSSSADYCSQLNYRKEFDSYFLEGGNLSGQRLGKALYCLSSKIRAVKKWIGHEHLEKQELINLLNQDFVKTKEVQPIIDHIIHPDHLDNYILIKDIVIHLIENKSKPLALSSHFCQKQSQKDSQKELRDKTATKKMAFNTHSPQKELRDKTVVKKMAFSAYSPQKELRDKTVFSKAETLVFVHFLEEMADFFITAQQSAQDAFDNFIKPNSKIDPRFLSRSKSIELDSFKTYWALFLTEYFKKDFPGYSHFILKNFFEKEDILQPLWDMAFLPSNSKSSAKTASWPSNSKSSAETASWPSNSKSFAETASWPSNSKSFAETASWPSNSKSFADKQSASLSSNSKSSADKQSTSFSSDSSSFSESSADKWTVQNIKYMMLNIFIMRALFLALDKDQNSVLSLAELEPLSCLIASVSSLIILPKTKDQREFIKNLYHPKAVANYIIQYQQIPSALSLHFIKYRLINQPEVTKKLSYGEVSRLISLMLSELFNQI